MHDDARGRFGPDRTNQDAPPPGTRADDGSGRRRPLRAVLLRAALRPPVVRVARRLLSLARRAARDASQGGAKSQSAAPVVVRFSAWDTVEVIRPAGGTVEHLSLLDGTSVAMLDTYAVLVEVEDIGSLVRLATSGVVQGKARSFQVRLAISPREHRAGLRPPRPNKLTTTISWSFDGRGSRLLVKSSHKRDLALQLHEFSSALVRAHHWEQTGGRLLAIDRSADLDGVAAWPAGVLRSEPVPAATPSQPHTLVSPRAAGLSVQSVPPVMTVVANPVGRLLVGQPDRLRVDLEPGRVTLRDPGGEVVLRVDHSSPVEAALAAGSWEKYAVGELTADPAGDPFAEHALRCLAATGMVFRSGDPAVRQGVEGLGLVVVDDSEREDLAWYRLSVDASRTATVGNDPVLRHTALTPQGGPIALPAVSLLVPSRRPDDLLRLIPALATQSYPNTEVVVGAHGYPAEAGDLTAAAADAGIPLRVAEMPSELTLGEVLGRLSRIADGEILTKVDDDDRYGHQHVTDLVLTLHTSGADLVAKGARFVYLADRDVTVDRVWAAPELHDGSIAGGTIMLPKRVLLEAGGWSESPRHVDTNLVERVRFAGGTVRRTHALDYVYVRNATGHTWHTDLDALMAQGETHYPGLPASIVETGQARHSSPAETA